MTRTYLHIFSLFCLILLMQSGCNRNGIKFPKVYPVDVTVTKNGEPVDKILVIFYPEDIIGSFAFQGETDSSGNCRIQTVVSGSRKFGCPKGDYKVGLTLRVATAAGKQEADQVKEWATGKTSGEYLAELKRRNDERKKANKILAEIVPEALRTKDKTPITFTVDGKSKLKIDLADYAK